MKKTSTMPTNLCTPETFATSKALTGLLKEHVKQGVTAAKLLKSVGEVSQYLALRKKRETQAKAEEKQRAKQEKIRARDAAKEEKQRLRQEKQRQKEESAQKRKARAVGKAVGLKEASAPDAKIKTTAPKKKRMNKPKANDEGKPKAKRGKAKKQPAPPQVESFEEEEMMLEELFTQV